jgi:hypothetical protein
MHVCVYVFTYQDLGMDYAQVLHRARGVAANRHGVDKDPLYNNVYITTHIRPHTTTCAHIHILTLHFTFAHMHMHTHIYNHVQLLLTHKYASTYTCIYRPIHTCKHIYVHTHIPPNTYIHTYA